MKILIKNGRVIDPAHDLDGISDVLVENGVIARVEKNIEETAETVIDAQGKIVMPGLVDMHVHLREPGREDKETVASGTKAASRGGVTTVLAMPNTTPAIDSPEQVRALKKIIQKDGRVHVLVAAAITRDRKGQELVDIAALKAEGVTAITDDGSSVESDEIMRQALQKAKEAGIPVICHCEDEALSRGGVINLGYMSTVLGLRGIPKEAEYKRVKRDIQLASETGAAVHIAHVSCLESVELIAAAKMRGVAVTAETAPHYFTLTEEALSGYDTNLKINPPLRTKKDVAALKEALKDGTIDAIASDHAPHTDNEKEIEFDRAEFGAIGLETELSVSITELGVPGILSWPELIKKMCLHPAKILKVDKGHLAVKADADIIVVDPLKEWVVTKEAFASMSGNCAFLGRTLKGVVDYTICAGKLVYRNRKATNEVPFDKRVGPAGQMAQDLRI